MDLMEAWRCVQDTAEKHAGEIKTDPDQEVTDELKQRVISAYDDLADEFGLDGKEVYLFCQRWIRENRVKLAASSMAASIEGRSMIADAVEQGLQLGIFVGAVYASHRIEDLRNAVEGD